MLDQHLDMHLRAFLQDLRLHLAEQTCIHERRKLLHFFKHVMLQKLDYRNLTRENVHGYLLSQENWCAHTRHNVWFSIKRFYDYLKANGVVDNNPADGITIRGRRHRTLMRVPPVDRIRRILHRLEAESGELAVRNRLMVELAYGSGLRRSEIAALNIEDIDVAAYTAHVPGKGRKERIVPLTGRCIQAFMQYTQAFREPRKFLIATTEGTRMDPLNVGATIKRITGLNAHMFRHACATHMLLNGCNIRCIQILLGHERIGTTTIYTNLDKNDLRHIVEKVHPGARRSYPIDS